jgi:hypothetical protein
MVEEVIGYTTAESLPLLVDYIAELKHRVQNVREISFAYGPTPFGAKSKETWYAVFTYDYDPDEADD